jgi:hypothetical protein
MWLDLASALTEGKAYHPSLLPLREKMAEGRMRGRPRAL